MKKSALVLSLAAIVSTLASTLCAGTAVSAKGLQTGSMVYSSDGTRSISVIYYDIRSNVTESRERTPFGTLRTTVSTYTYSGQPLKSTVTEGSVTMVTENTYHSGSGLLTATDVTVNGVKQRVSAVVYDDLGRIVSVTRGAASNSGGKVAYKYNIHGQTTSIAGPGFTQTLHYADGPGTKLYNGSVSAMTWTMGTDTRVRGYKYTYNGYGWLTSADYGEGSSLSANKDRYSERSTSFTRNGGIRKLQRNGLMTSGSYGKVDDLTVEYSGNRMTSVLDVSPVVTHNGSMDFPGGNIIYRIRYNGFGAPTFDVSRNITSISYDNFGNPTVIQFLRGIKTSSVYSATGVRLKTENTMEVADQSLMDIFPQAEASSLMENEGLASAVVASASTEYHGSFIYKNGKLDMVLFPGGYATVAGTAVTFHYYTQDYLGNNRAVINGSTGAIEQTVAYYPYGAVIADLGTPTTGQPYKFGGKELITANGLNEYDFGARQYYSAVPGFTRPDDKCEKYYWLSPYLYCANNPVNFIDPTGKIIQMSSESSLSDCITVLMNMQLITDDELFLSRHEDGSFRIGISSFKDGNKRSGSRLVRRVSGSERTMTVAVASEGGNQERSENPVDAINGKGTNTTVVFNPDFDPDIPEVDPSSGNIVNGKRPPYVGLAHEMIHADRGMRGVAFDYSKEESHSFYDFYGNPVVEFLPQEEAATIGFNYLDRINSFNITENSIRLESGLKQRGAYYSRKKR